MKTIIKKLKYVINFAAVFCLCYLPAIAQTPQGLPNPDDNEPLALDNWTNIIFFIVIPLLFVALFVWLRAKRKKGN